MSRIGTIFVFMILFLFVGCNTPKDSTPVIQKEKKNQTVKKEESKPSSKTITNAMSNKPLALKDVSLVPEGKYAGEPLDEQRLYHELEQLPRNLSYQDYFDKLLELLGQDYQHYIHTFENFNTQVEVDGKMPSNSEMPNVPKNKEVNISILLDASGSMSGEMNGQTKMALAKKSIQQFMAVLPKNSNISLRVYGHKGSNQQKDKKISCHSSDLVYPLGSYKANAFSQSLSQVKPTGWTPLALAIEEAQKDLGSHTGENVQNIIYIVSDGIETCGGNPVKAAKLLHDSNIKAIVNIIGFDINDAGQNALKQVAEAGQGTFTSVDSKVDLEKYFQKESTSLYKKWAKWGTTNWHKAQDIGDNKHDYLEKFGSEFRKKIKLERRQLHDAYQYLNKKDYVNYTFYEFIDKRDDILMDYALKKQNMLQSQVLDNWGNTQDKISDKRREEQEKALNHGE
jgi:D-amino-acid dehydrogenase/Ca-activated chloride channel family protein